MAKEERKIENVIKLRQENDRHRRKNIQQNMWDLHFKQI